MADLLSLNDVSKSYTAITGEVVEAIRGVSFDLHEREVLTLVGPSGCGKSTILRLIAGVEKPSSGSIERRAAGGEFVVGYIFQDSSLMRWRTVYGNIKLPMEILGKKGWELARLASSSNSSTSRVSRTPTRSSCPAGCRGGWLSRAHWSMTRASS